MRTIKLSDLTKDTRAARRSLRRAYASHRERLPTRIGGRWVFPATDKRTVLSIIR